MSDDPKRLSDSEIAHLLESKPPPAADDTDPKERTTKRTCCLCGGDGLVTPLVAEAYYCLVRKARRDAGTRDTSDLDVDPDGEEGGEL